MRILKFQRGFESSDVAVCIGLVFALVLIFQSRVKSTLNYYLVGDGILERAQKYAVTQQYSIVSSPRIQCATHADASQHGCELGDIEVFLLNDTNEHTYTLHIRRDDERLTLNN